MGDDSKVPRKHKRRTTQHKKHVAYPGMRNHPDATIVSGSIRVEQKQKSNVKEATFPRLNKEPADIWDKYDKVAKSLGHNGSSSPLPMRAGIEDAYGLLSKKLVRIGQLNKLKKKYRLR
jgi:hypothetical protein